MKLGEQVEFLMSNAELQTAISAWFAVYSETLKRKRWRDVDLAPSFYALIAEQARRANTVTLK